MSICDLTHMCLFLGGVCDDALEVYLIMSNVASDSSVPIGYKSSHI